jgi:predicted ATPase
MMKLHVKSIAFHPDRYPTLDRYPFNLPIFGKSQEIGFRSPVTFFVGENGSGKSTLLKAMSRRCGIFIWGGTERPRFDFNPYEERLHQAIDIEWHNGPVAGAFFGSDLFRHFAEILDEWALTDQRQLDYFGGKSLLSQSHGQSILSFFQARYAIKGIYFIDEPETALSPQSQLKLLKLLIHMGAAGHAQFIIATHSPLLMACPGAEIYSFDHNPIQKISYQATPHFKIYKAFMADPDSYLNQSGS